MPSRAGDLVKLTIVQDKEIGRPSRVYVDVQHEEALRTEMRVVGHSVVM